MFDGLTVSVLAEIIAAVFLPVVGGALYLLFRRIPRDLGQFSRDWNGQPGRPGFPAVPGVPARLENVESTLGELKDYVVKIDHEVHFNSGASIKDAVHRTDESLAELREEMHVLQASVDTKSSQFSVDSRSSQASVDKL